MLLKINTFKLEILLLCRSDRLQISNIGMYRYVRFARKTIQSVMVLFLYAQPSFYCINSINYIIVTARSSKIFFTSRPQAEGKLFKHTERLTTVDICMKERDQ